MISDITDCLPNLHHWLSNHNLNYAALHDCEMYMWCDCVTVILQLETFSSTLTPAWIDIVNAALKYMLYRTSVGYILFKHPAGKIKKSKQETGFKTSSRVLF